MDKSYYIYKHYGFVENTEYVFFGVGSHNAYKNKSGKNKLHISVWGYLNKIILVNNLSQCSAIDAANTMITEIQSDNRIVSLNKRLIPKVTEVIFNDLKENLSICKDSPSGLLWLKGQDTGKFAGCLGKDGYFRLLLNGKYYLAHRILYSLYHKVDLPSTLQIDHINRNKNDNSISNLRLVSPKENVRNRSTKVGSSGIRNVNFDKDRKRWIARWYNGKKGCSKIFNPRTLFPNEPENIALDKARHMAIEFINTLKEGE